MSVLGVVAFERPEQNECWLVANEAMITGQGRWGLYVKRPSAMIEYYRQATLDEKLNTTDLTLTKQPTKPKKL